MAESSYYYPIYAKESKDVPERMRSSHEWQTAVAVDKLPKYQLKVKLCCLKCEEKVIEEIREVRGVFDVRAERFHSKVVVVASTTSGLDEHEVLRKARKINRKAKFVPLDDKEKPKKKKEEAEAEYIYKFKPFVHWGPSSYYTPSTYYTPSRVAYVPDEYRPSQNYAPRYYYTPSPVAYVPDEYRPSQNYAPRFHYPSLPGPSEDDYFLQYVYDY